MPERHKNGNVSDAELNALLAEWAEAEIEPPAGFHEQTMNRLRAEVQPVKKNNVISLFAKNRRWTSIAAAAVLVLFCVPVVQGQLGQNPTDKVMDTQQMQVAQNSDTADTNSVGITENSLQTGDKANAAVKTNTIQAEPNKAEKADKKTVMNSVVIPEIVENNTENGIAVAQLPAEDENMPMAAAFFLEDDTAPAVDSQNARMAEEQPAAYTYRNGADEESLEVLEQKLKDAEAMLAEYQAQLETHPEDATLQELVAEQQKAIEELKTKIEEWKKQDNEQQAE